MEDCWAAGRAWGGPRSEGDRRGPLGHGGKSLYGENVVSDCNLAVYFLVGGQCITVLLVSAVREVDQL